MENENEGSLIKVDKNDSGNACEVASQVSL